MIALTLAMSLSGCAGKGESPADISQTQISETTLLETETAAQTHTEAHISSEPSKEPRDEEMVSVKEYIPSIYIELKYATTDNFTGKVIYDFEQASLRYGTVKKLIKAQNMLLEKGYSLKIWDAYRPVKAQFKLWEVYPDNRYVANPNKGYSNHSRGNTVDVTLVKTGGEEITMPTGFDDFSKKADRDYGDASKEAAENAMLLENTMSECGFECYFSEWWHFSDSKAYEVVKDS